MFSFLKGKKAKEPELPPLPKEEELELPPLPEDEIPPPPEEPMLTAEALPEEKLRGFGDFPTIKARESKEEPMPQIPEIREETAPLAEYRPAEEYPELPKVALKKEGLPRVIKHRMPTSPLFVSVHDYKEIMNNSNAIKAKLTESEDIIKRLNELKNDEEKELEIWRMHLEDIERKLSYIDKSVFEGG